ncbi:MAG: sulfoxide reductase heme-binding subunit YedZ [Ignavibacteriae bacterium]|nr:sulfoxide reductase heme-binding subunit YedZ [Ignavibacteriota bacterium]
MEKQASSIKHPASRIKWIAKPVVFLSSLLPAIILTWQLLNDELSANPIDDITDATGTWTLRFLCITLAVTPLKTISGWNLVGQFRRMLGLFAFFYASLHFTTYIYLDQFFEWESIVADVAKRPFITVGFASFVLLIPLAVTSFNKMIKWLGGKRWKWLHRLVYLIAIGGVIHYLWLVKADTQRPLTYGAIVLVLLAIRVYYFFRSKQKKILDA